MRVCVHVHNERLVRVSHHFLKAILAASCRLHFMRSTLWIQTSSLHQTTTPSEAASVECQKGTPFITAFESPFAPSLTCSIRCVCVCMYVCVRVCVQVGVGEGILVYLHVSLVRVHVGVHMGMGVSVNECMCELVCALALVCLCVFVLKWVCGGLPLAE
jgi:hypothetical protein